ncbi:MAG: hypothetical protein ABTQ31_07970 [Rhizobiaceae bacterium]
MIQSVLFFILGFLSAGFLALLVMPAVVRRASTLTRKRVEATAPLSLAEIQADKDRLRAEFAMTARRLEMSVQTYRDRATSQLAELGRAREEQKALAAERDDRAKALAQMEARANDLRAELDRSQDEGQKLSRKLAEAERATLQHGSEIDRLGRLYDDASFASSSRQIDLVARESEVERLTAELAASRREKDGLEVRRAGLDEQVARLEQARADAETKAKDLGDRLAEAQAELARSAAGLEEARARLGEAEARQEETDIDLAETKGDHLKVLGEVDSLKAQLAAITARKPGAPIDEAGLREEMAALAAEVIRLTILMDGPNSPIARTIGADAAGSRSAPDDAPLSLAERVKALQRQTLGG